MNSPNVSYKPNKMCPQIPQTHTHMSFIHFITSYSQYNWGFFSAHALKKFAESNNPKTQKILKLHLVFLLGHIFSSN